jgi:transcription-repair coupling factor (superfamily II helicase)
VSIKSITEEQPQLWGGLLASPEMDRIAAAFSTASESRLPRLGQRRQQSIIVSGLAGSARALFLAALEKRTGRQIVLLTRSNREIEDIQPDVEFFYSAMNARSSRVVDCSPVLAIPSSESDPYDGVSPHPDVLEQRALALYRAARGSKQTSIPSGSIINAEPASGSRGSAASRGVTGESSNCEAPRILLTSLRAAAERTVAPERLRASGLVLGIGDEMPLELLVDLLISGGYVRQEPVTALGEFSLRGGILDVFSPSNDAPHRIEFFGDTVDSIREFDLDTQRSTVRTNESTIAPMREVTVRREDFMAWAEAARERWTDDRFRRDLSLRMAHAERGEAFPGWEYLLPLTRPLDSSLLDYFSDAILVIDEPVELDKAASDLYRYLDQRFTQADESGELALPPDALFLPIADLYARVATPGRVELRLLGQIAGSTDEQFHLESVTLPDTVKTLPPASDAETPSQEQGGDHQRRKVFLFPLDERAPEIQIFSRAPRRYHGRINELASDLASPVDEGTRLLVLPSIGVAERVKEMLQEYSVEARYLPSLDMLPGLGAKDRANAGVIATVGRLANGFELPVARLSILVESDIFGDVERVARQRVVQKASRKRRSIEAFLSDLGDLKVGDYVVHVDHGIGQFQGLVQIPVVGGGTAASFNVAEGIGRAPSVREFMLLTYAEKAKLYVPVERLDLIQRFSAGEGHNTEVDRLGGVGWEKKKAKAKRAMKDMAEELLRLYAERKLVGGHSYGADSPWQLEFEDAFEYQLTPDQETAVEDVKSDMGRSEPMDRLIVGDVGYGKTEVAMRAAFKAVMEGKQAAVLSPTTVLAYQHFETFKSRLSAFPVRVEMLSRFRTAKEQKRVVESVEAGSVDVIVGTHRLLSKDIKFKDLGLLVVDEEQRFGVAHKERIKQLRKKVDVIALSATPIPRTLNMSLAGLRDISVIETPPRDRLAIQTQVIQFAEPVIRSAIDLELQRGGQVFFVHNRVETIESIAELVARLVPNARIGVAHGQMGERDLEAVMLKFIRHDLDILVCTTIIENGIDIPLANTIIINRADAYGLSQLYQLRGRVGRSSRRAYAYLLIPSEEGLTTIARRRLAAIREFSDLGAGFRIAALDLELRGAGNLLGREQSGHVDAIGFDLYTQMLERAVRELKGEPVQDDSSTAVNIGIDIRIPQDYIYDMSQRLRVYKRVSSAESETALRDIYNEIEDRYGPIPETVGNLFEHARLRREASALGIISIDKEGDRLSIKFAEKARINPDKLIAFVSSGAGSLTPAGVLRMPVESDDDSIFMEVRNLLDRLR